MAPLSDVEARLAALEGQVRRLRLAGAALAALALGALLTGRTQAGSPGEDLRVRRLWAERIEGRELYLRREEDGRAYGVWSDQELSFGVSDEELLRFRVGIHDSDTALVVNSGGGETLLMVPPEPPAP